MKIQIGDTVRVIKKTHPWRRARRDFFGLIGRVEGKVYVPKSKAVPSGVLCVVQIGSHKVRIPINHLKRLLTNSKEGVSTIV